MQYPSNPINHSINRPDSRDDEVEVGVIVAAGVRVRCLLDPDWGSIVVIRIAPDECAQYLGTILRADTEAPSLHLGSRESWRLPTPESREEMRLAIARLYRDWKDAQ